MSLFCFLWTPFFYLFRRSITGGEGGAGAVMALLLGSVVALFQFFLGSLVNPGGFGFSRWVSGFVDIVSLPVLVPLAVCLLFILFRVFAGTPDFVNFTLLWFIPAAALRSLSWSAQNDPILLVLVPLLWTAIAVGIPFFINIIASGRLPVIISAAFAILAIPLLAATSYWAFFSQKTALGFCLFFITLVPAAFSIVFSMVKNA
ncbi:MAG: hypothetical protein LBK02_05785 [Treponema sp.]|jgi:hypothetical protein|nr:hypothetical protein [Treponema sp.]